MDSVDRDYRTRNIAQEIVRKYSWGGCNENSAKVNFKNKNIIGNDWSSKS